MAFMFEQTADRMASSGIGTNLVDMGYAPVQGSMDTFVNNVWLVLLSTCPVDTGRMVSNMRLEQYGGIAKITISAVNPKTMYNYALAVNEGLAAAHQGRAMSVKEARNFHWVQKSLNTAAQITALNTNYFTNNNYTAMGKYVDSDDLLFNLNQNESW